MSLHGLMDYHTHTGVTVDSKETENACCHRAVELGLSEIAFTNHIMLGNPDYCMTPESMKEHSENIKVCQEHYPQLNIRMGLEMDYFENQEEEIAAVIQHYEEIAGRPFDFIMGAAHYLRDVFFSSKQYAPTLFRDANNSAATGDFGPLISIYDEYFGLMRKAVESGLFQNIAHIDLIKKYSGEIYPPLKFEAYQDTALALIRSLIEKRVGIELNTKGLTFKMKEFFPSENFLKLYVSESKKHGVAPLITLGGDAHQAENIGANFSEGIQAIKQAGCKQLTGFNRKQAFMITI